MMRRKEQYKVLDHLTTSYEFRVRFNETDPLGIVWHGNYIKYFEDGREAFGRKYGISYLDVQAAGYTTPIVKTLTEHKLPLRYGETARVETALVDSIAAKMIFLFTIYNEKGEVVCTGETVQVFVEEGGELCLTYPPFYQKWLDSVRI
ncbi:thioesterase superfamily protein [Leadbetterella byssophila DSM 17132]|jgi:acyl-CoA thioester hydrolase|uniref:Thioesterase superfamily protein n=1 Tax=Leadbetterella byssophila (strain DSM 17132 / JCM 16389 / KACC 11308 / NBRC 106382 / 4M15) TaxID=649349 RepID=E4RXH9_LEAB4|nr:acyl-CoA thioesterase [Leadbetterella byssophila]ADQ17214.1 thioesterase superfamily protein [Leadbetterella byssophila DSM 17132]